MMIQSDDGFVLDLDDADLDTEASRMITRGFLSLMKALWDTLMVEPVNARRAGEAKLTIALIKLARQYFDQTIKCTEAQAWFAASLAGMATMETVLLMACISEKATVVTTKAWTSFHKKRKVPFRDRLMHVDMGKLLEIATELKWFPTDTGYHTFLESYGEWPEELEEFTEVLDTPASMIAKSVDICNLVHPARCLREELQIDDRTGMLALGFFYMSLLGLLHNMGRDLLKQGETRLNFQYSPQLKRLIAARETVQKFVSEDLTSLDDDKNILKTLDATKGVLEMVRPVVHDLQNPEA
jgi:hypothetical protein